MKLPSLVLEHAFGQPPLLGGGRMVCIDGPAGSGKSTLADALLAAAAERVERAQVLHLDDLLDGWHGLGSLAPRLRNYVVGPLASGHEGRYRRFDWVSERFAEEHRIAPLDLLVLDGVGSGSRDLRSRRATLVWVEAPPLVRLRRGLERDGAQLRDAWLQWMADEARHFAHQRTRELADFLLDGTTSLGGGRLFATDAHPMLGSWRDQREGREGHQRPDR